MIVKINGQHETRIKKVTTLPITRPGSLNHYYEGIIDAETFCLFELMKLPAFTMEVDGKTYNTCRCSGSTGKFWYMPS